MDEVKVPVTVRKELEERLDAILGAGKWKMWASHPQKPGESSTLIYLAREDASGYVAYGYLSPFPGCCGLVVSWGAQVTFLFRHKGIGAIMNLVRIDYARSLGYGQLICTDKTINDPQRRILAKNGWKDILEFTNPRTHNHIAVSVVKLQ